MNLLSPRPQTLLLMKGHPGCGKSCLASSLARSLQWPLIDKDIFRDAPLPLETVSPQVDAALLNTLSYDAMWHMANLQLSVGLSVIVDCPLAHRRLFQTGEALSRKHCTRLCVVECRISDVEVWKRRISGRAQKALQEMEPPSEHQRPPYHRAQPKPVPSDTPLSVSPSAQSSVAFPLAAESIRGSDSTALPEPVLDPPSMPFRSDGEGHSCQADTGGSASSAGGAMALAELHGSELRGRWHKPATWEDLQAILNRYDGCWRYDLGDTPVRVVDTGSRGVEDLVRELVIWLDSF